MATRHDILPPAQKALLPVLAPLRRLGFVLYGGTAIALQLGHRTSVDFDFFTDQPLDREATIAAVAPLAAAIVLQDEPDAWTVLMRPAGATDSIKVSYFASLGFGRIGHPTTTSNGEALLASLDDLPGHKLKVRLQRIEAKDYREILAMLGSGLTLEHGLGAAVALFPNFPACEAIKALTYLEGGDLSSLSETDRATLIQHAGHVGLPARVSILSRRLAAD